MQHIKLSYYQNINKVDQLKINLQCQEANNGLINRSVNILVPKVSDEMIRGLPITETLLNIKKRVLKIIY
jgi:hypothetical protein